MNPKWYFLLVIVVILAAASFACTLTRASAPTPFIFPVPNLTLTALFYPTFLPPTRTPLPLIVQTNTPIANNSTNEPSGEISQTPTQMPPTATKTDRPTESYVGPQERKGPSVVAVYMDQAPTIDGTFDEWIFDRYDISSVVAGKSQWSSNPDLSGNLMIGWNEKFLFIAARVKDDIYKQNASGENLFKGDSLELLLDTIVSGDFYQKSLSGDDYQLGISPGSPQPGKNPEAYLWYPQSRAGEKKQVKIGAMAAGDGYRVEAQIPWDMFDVKASVGKHFGFAFSISDNDKSGENIQQSMVSNDASRILNNPTTWGDLTLAGGPTSKKRSGTSISASYMNTPPTIDGDFGDWSLSPISVKNVVYGKSNWDGANDLSGSVMVGWDDDNLYLGAKVRDEKYVQNTTGENLFKGDSLEILLDKDLIPDFSSTDLDSDDYQLGISPGSPTMGDHPQAYLWYPSSKAGKRSQVIIAAIPVADGYQVEVAIPWSVFGMTPNQGHHYGFSISISDNDNINKDVQQSMVSNVWSRVLTDPTTWGDLILIKH